MGIIADHLCSVIARQVGDYGLVVWYDPDGHYRDVALALALPSTAVVAYQHSFYALRHAVDAYLNHLEPPRLVVYVPLDQTETHQALIELEVAGAVMQPGQQPPLRNTRLSVIARNALKATKQWTDEDAEQVSRDIEAGKYRSIDEIEHVVARRGGATGVLQLVFDSGNPDEVALKFLCDTHLDAKITDKQALPELTRMINTRFEAGLRDADGLDVTRARLARHILTADLLAGLHDEIPPQLSALKPATNPVAREACVALANTWRLRRDLRDRYVAHAQRVEQEIGVPALSVQPDQIAGVETFLSLERALQHLVEVALLAQPREQLLELARTRQSSFWSELLPDMQAQWALIAAAGQVLLEADRISLELKSTAGDAAALLAAYTADERPWCLLDTYHRHMERRYHTFDFDLGERHQSLEQLVVSARQRYMDVGAALAESFVQRYRAAKFQISSVLRQVEVFEKKVKPRLADGKLAYVLVDALRYEMGRELIQSMSAEFDVEFEPALATVPTITEIGMAALLPDAHRSPAVVLVAESKLALEIDGTVVKDRKERVAFLKSRAGVDVFEAKLDDLLPSPKKKIRDGISHAQLILITSQEIDVLSEGDNVPLARRIMDEALHELRRALRVLSELGVGTIVLAADHGYLFGDELGSDMKIDPPGGDTADLHRRVWVGHGGTADAAYLRASLADFGLGGDLDIAVPWNFAGFKVKGGSKAYFHGGLSLPELVIPVATLTPNRSGAVGSVDQVAWTLTPGTPKITTRFVSVQITGQATGLFDLVAPKVRLEIRAKGDTLSQPVSASYGFEEATGDVQLRLAVDNPKAIEPNTVTLMLVGETQQKTATIHLLDATTNVELKRLEKVEIAISL